VHEARGLTGPGEHDVRAVDVDRLFADLALVDRGRDLHARGIGRRGSELSPTI
jgi:hypothetical protein